MPDETTEPVTPEPTLIPIPVLEHLNDSLPAFYVHDDALHARDLNATVPLRAPRGLVKKLEDLPLLDQFEMLLRFHDDELADRLDGWDAIDAREFARKWFQAYTEKEQARLGESFSSSPM